MNENGSVAPMKFESQEAWASAGKTIASRRDGFQWQLGEWLAFGENAYGKASYKEAEKITGLARHSLYEISRVFRSTCTVRTAKLTFEHHRVVAGDSVPVTEKSAWLEKAQANKWLSARLKGEILKADADPNNADQSKPNLTVRLCLAENVLQDLQCLAEFSEEFKGEMTAIVKYAIEAFLDSNQEMLGAAVARRNEVTREQKQAEAAKEAKRASAMEKKESRRHNRAARLTRDAERLKGRAAKAGVPVGELLLGVGQASAAV